MKANNKRKVFGDAVDLLMDEIEGREVPRGIQLIQIKNIQPFHDHPFHLYEGERLEDMIASVKEHGILNPVIVQKIDGGYEMLSGHNRMNAAKLVGLKEVPAIVKTDLSEEEAYVYVIETNLMQRSFSDLLISEKAAVLKARYEKESCQGRRNDIIEEIARLEGKEVEVTRGHGDHRMKTRDTIGKEYELSGSSVGRLLKLNDLIKPFKDISYSPVVQVKFLVDLKNREIQVYNEHNSNRIHVANIRQRDGRNARLTDILLTFEKMNKGLPEKKRKQTIVYFNGRNKAIDAAREFSGALGDAGIKNDDLLDILAKDIRQEVHGDYFLADMIRKGIAFHIGYLPASIRARIETLFQDGHITIMFCTSTLLEGVNLPADNLFITDNKIFRSEMEPVDFRNLIGRVGRISFNLYGNVYFVTDEVETVKSDDYVRMLQDKVPEQVLSIATNPKVLKKVEKQYVADILKSGSSVIPQRVNANGDPLQSEESYIMMRKFGLILQKDIVEDRDTLVRREFKEFLTDEDEIKIRETFKNAETIPDDDINTSVDQTKRLIMAIKNDDLHYPEVQNGFFKHDVVLSFLDDLSRVFQWDIYESSTLGKASLRSWYAVILCQWMEGNGLNYIMKEALKHRKKNPQDFWINRYTKGVYDDTSLIHRNIVFADTLEVIENIILFSISNYFLRFSNEYRRIKGDAALDRNNWYEYVEYGTTNPLTILLQRNGFSRESARFIKENPDYVVKDGSTGQLKLSDSLVKCGRTSIENEVAYIRQNVPGIFVCKE